MDDDALIAGMATGDTGAAEMFIRRHAAAVVGVAFAVVGERGAAEDVAQEAFWRAWRAADSYDVRRGSGQAWLLAIARNAAIDQVRVRRAQPIDPDTLSDLLAETDSDGVRPDEPAMARAEAAEVRQALTRLPDDQRRALLMAAVGGRSAMEVAEAEGIPLGTAKTRIRTGLGRLRRALEETANRGV